MLRVRDEETQDRAAVRQVNEAAFGEPAEADLVEALHGAGAARIALVAENDGVVAGHILFSPITINDVEIPGLGLAPMAVLPGYQRTGIGSELVRQGLDRCKALGIAAVVVLGHRAYYPRFGFTPASNWQLRSEYPSSEESFMALELQPGYLAQLGGGLVKYHPTFSSF